MKKLEVLLVEDDIDVCEEFVQQIALSDEIILVGVTNNSAKALEYTKNYLPDVIILDLELQQGGGNGLFLLKELPDLMLTKKPYILVTTNNSSKYTYETAHSLGADFIMSKHQNGYSTKSVLDFLQIIKPTIQSSKNIALSNTKSNNTPLQIEKRVKKQITKELNLIGINPKSKGYLYLIDAIYIAKDASSHRICTTIADKYHKSEPSVERAMQNAINRAWKTNDIEDLLIHYTAKINSEKGCPTVTEFICYYAQKLTLEY